MHIVPFEKVNNRLVAPSFFDYDIVLKLNQAVFGSAVPVWEEERE